MGPLGNLILKEDSNSEMYNNLISFFFAGLNTFGNPLPHFSYSPQIISNINQNLNFNNSNSGIGIFRSRYADYYDSINSIQRQIFDIRALRRMFPEG